MTAPQRLRTASVCLFVSILLVQQAGRTQNPPPDALRFFKNYFGTIDYVVAGKGLEGLGVNGLASGSIDMTGAPPNAEALAAFLYWQVVSADGSDAGATSVRFNGQLLSAPGPPFTSAGGPLAVVGDPGGTSPCWSSGGGTGAGGSKRTYTYRSDVLRFLPVVNGRHQINVAHTVQLPDSGNSNSTPRALGASLVVIYRHPDAAAPMNAVVIYDGSSTLNNSTSMVSQTIKGYYDAVAGVPGQITYIAGSGQANKPERLVGPGILEFNPFQAFQGSSWDNVTRATASPAGDAFTTTVDNQGLGTFDCLTFGAIVYRTRVNDTDGDGLLDRWESSASTIFDPNGEPLPNLSGIARPDRKDLFLEMGYFETAGAETYNGVSKPQHTHQPTHEALKKVGDAFAAAPVTNPDLSTGIRVHFDLGNGFPAGAADAYIVRGALARGGESLNETSTVCTRAPTDPPWVCQFSDPGTVGWKSGFRFIRDMPLTLSDDACEAAERDGDPATVCERRFDRNRKDIFRYVLFAHALGVPKEDCIVDNPLSSNFGFADETCQNTNPLFHVPATNTGVGDYLGGDALVTLGAFDNAAGKPVGSDYAQASTLMHELGHGLGLRHGGDPVEPNCKPNYLSVMNYLFQLRGLRDDAGVAHLNFSGQNLNAIDERFLSEAGGLSPTPVPPYRTGWYAPQGPGTVGSPATRHCDGTPLLSTDASMVRVDSTSVDGNIDWTKSPDLPSPLGQDINFDGVVGPLNAGYNDWANLRLNQVGSRRNVGGWFWVPDPVGDYVAFIGPLSLGVTRGDLGRGDLGRGDLGGGDPGRGDLGRGDLGRGDLGRGDLGRGDLGRGDLGRGDLGRGDLGRGDLGRGDLGVGSDQGAAEVTADVAAAAGFAPPNELTATVVGLTTACAGLSPADCHRIRLRWTPPDVGLVTQYKAYRLDSVTGAPIQVGSPVPAVLGQAEYFHVDTQELPNGPFTYYVVAEFGAITGGPSNSVTITAVNDVPVAAAESHSTDYGVPLVVAAPGVLSNDTDRDSPSLTAQLVTGPAHGTLVFNANGSFTYTPNAGFFGPDEFTYRARDVDPGRGSNVVTVSLTVNKLVYGFVNVQNLPPPSNKTFKRGSTVGLKWQFTLGGVPVNSANADVSITITDASGVSITFRPQEPGHNEFKPPTAANGWTWQFNWQTVIASGPLEGTALPVGNYTVRVISGLTEQTFPAPPAIIKLVK